LKSWPPPFEHRARSAGGGRPHPILRVSSSRRDRIRRRRPPPYAESLRRKGRDREVTHRAARPTGLLIVSRIDHAAGCHKLERKLAPVCATTLGRTKTLYRPIVISRSAATAPGRTCLAAALKFTALNASICCSAPIRAASRAPVPTAEATGIVQLDHGGASVGLHAKGMRMLLRRCRAPKALPYSVRQ
jgi:hypothetical protein